MAEREPGVVLDRRELATVLAALRFWQSAMHVPARFNVIATDGDQIEPLTGDEIDALCERINA